MNKESMETKISDKDSPHEHHLADGVIISIIVLSIIFFILVNELLKYASRHYVIMKMTSVWRWRNLAVSWIHADLCAFGCVYCYVVHGHHVQSLSDLLDLKPMSAYILVAFSTGYFMYDMLDYTRNGQAKSQWEVTAHHIAVIAIFGYNLGYHVCISYSVLALVVEINSVFLHGRKLLQMLNVPFHHWFYRLTATLNLISFVVFRGPPLVLIWVGLLSNLHRYSLFYIALLGSVMVFMIVLNPILFWRLLKNDVLRKHQSKKDVVQNGNSGSNEGKKKPPELMPEQNGCRQTVHVKSDGVWCQAEDSISRGEDSFSRGRSEHSMLNRSKAS